MSDLVRIPLANVEYRARFERPYPGLIANDRSKVFEAVLTALLPFDLRLANTEIITTGALDNHKAIFKIPERGISFQFGAEEYRFGKEGASWSTADEDFRALACAERPLLAESGAKVKSCMVTIAMHLQPLAKTREEILGPFVPEPFKAFMTQRQADTFGNHLKWTDGDVLLDFSLGFANGIFLRLTSQFEGQPPLAEILAKVRRDEEAVFEILGVEEATDV